MESEELLKEFINYIEEQGLSVKVIEDMSDSYSAFDNIFGKIETKNCIDNVQFD